MNRYPFFFVLLIAVFFSACSSDKNVDDPSNVSGGSVAYSSLFDDALFTTLKAGVTANDVNRCDNAFYKKLAIGIFNKTYQTEFRVAEFKAYPKPEIQSGTNKTTPYSLLDNPTGISVTAGDTLVVFVGDTHGYKVALKVQNLNSTGDGFGGDSYTVTAGLNKLYMKHDGLVYVMYQTTTLDDASALPIKMHFALANVNGYFDVTRDAGRWSDRIGKATNAYYDVVGKYAHITFERNDLMKIDGEQLIRDVDSLVYHEQLLMGLKKYNRMFRNRMYLDVIYSNGAWMYSTSYRTSYHKNTMSGICNPAKLVTSECWGPAHEIGHSNQTRPGMKWLGTTEVTNNIMSEYIQTDIFGQPSRIQVEDMGKYYRNRYSKAWSSIIAAGSAHSRFQSIDDSEGKYSSDVFCKLVPFWQLQLYFGNVLGRTPRRQADFGGFYPDIYEYTRTHDNLSGAGNQQTEFVYICSKLSGYNLIDFFTKWGFLTPIDVTIDDYGNGQMTVTQARIDEVKSRVEALGLPKPDVALEYISDATWPLYLTKPAVVSGSSVRDGSKLTMSGWQNVVAYEVKDAAGRLLFISSGINTASSTAWFTVPFGWDSSYKVYAVSAGGQRTEVTF